jgi:hypothetical protein
MPVTRKRGAAVTVATLGLLLVGALSGCSSSKGDDQKDTSSAAQPSPTPTPTPTPSDEPSATPSTLATPTPSASATPRPPKDALLNASELPALNEAFVWKEGRTAQAGPNSFGLCQQFDTLSIGAVSAVERSFSSVGSSVDTAGQQVAQFPDAQNTVRADKVLEAWQRDCRRKVLDQMSSVRNAKVGAITTVAVPRGKGWYYVVSYTRAGKGHFHEFGVTYDGNRMSLLKMDHAGQDHDYPPGQDPMELAVKAASAKM